MLLIDDFSFWQAPSGSGQTLRVSNAQVVESVSSAAKDGCVRIFTLTKITNLHWQLCLQHLANTGCRGGDAGAQRLRRHLAAAVERLHRYMATQQQSYFDELSKNFHIFP